MIPNTSQIQTTIDLRNERFSKHKLNQQNQQYNNYSINLSHAEELAKIEKFKTIIISNPINLGIRISFFPHN